MAWILPGVAALVLLGSVIGMVFLARDSSRRKKVYEKFTEPSRFDYDIVVIGGGPAGMEAAKQAASFKAKVLLIERERLGGDSLSSASIPSKALIRSSQVAHLFRRGHEFGMQEVIPQTDFSRVFTRIHKVIKKAQPSLEGLGIDSLKGEAKIADPFRVHVGEKILTTKNIIVASGASPAVPDIAGLPDVPHYTSESVWQMKWVPKKLLVMGGGPTGCEMAQAFARLGCDTTLVEQRSSLLRKEDPDVGALVMNRFKSEGIKVNLSAEIVSFEKHASGGKAILKGGGVLEFDAVIVGLGRRPRTQGFGLENLGVAIRRDGTIEVDDHLRTKYSNIFAVGDVTGPFQFAHAGALQAKFAALNAVFQPAKTFKIDYGAVPWCTYVDPQVARVGLNETIAKEHGIEYDLHTLPLDRVDRALCDGEEYGLIKVLTTPNSGEILGVTVVGANAGETIAEFVLAIRKNLSLDDILETVHIYPSYADANRLVAGVWKLKHGLSLSMKLLLKYQARKGESKTLN